MATTSQTAITDSFHLTHKELIELHESLKDETSPVIIAGIGEEYTNEKGTRMIPLRLVQKSIVNSSAPKNKAVEILMGWSNSRLLSTIANATPDFVKNYKEGDVLEGFDLKLERSTVPFHAKNELVKNPSTNVDLWYYQNTTLVLSVDNDGVYTPVVHDPIPEQPVLP